MITYRRLFFVLLVLIAGQSSSAVASGLSCDISAAVKLSDPTMVAPQGSRAEFQIFWHIATQIEDIADASSRANTISDISATQKLVDGYYVNPLLGGPLTYWPDRPAKCALNKKMRTTDSTATCKAEQQKMRQTRGEGDDRNSQFKALVRAFKVLDLTAEQSRGKQIMGEMILDNSEVTYSTESDQLTLSKLPRTVCVLADAGKLAANDMMIYQEPVPQSRVGSFLWVPRKEGQKVEPGADPKAYKIPENARIFPMLRQAFDRAGVPLGKMFPNFRVWNRRSPALVNDLAQMPEIGGFNFEGGASILAEKQKKLEMYAEGISWILQKTKKNVSVLMPGYWPGEGVVDPGDIDTLPVRTRDFVLELDRRISEKMGLSDRQHAICTGRMIFIPASYGRPMHVKTLPSRRNGQFAGTVTGQIQMLAELRTQLCGD